MLFNKSLKGSTIKVFWNIEYVSIQSQAKYYNYHFKIQFER